ncbi:MAG: hypothetical protein FWE53_00320 [Firmicutes bacterium]|nr:hypothetical protein [Bacillota bacterium]
MTKKELRDYAKRYYLGILIALPVIIAVSWLLEPHINFWLLVVIDALLMGVAIIVSQVVYEHRLKIRQRKKAEKQYAAKLALHKANEETKPEPGEDLPGQNSPSSRRGGSEADGVAGAKGDVKPKPRNNNPNHKKKRKKKK